MKIILSRKGFDSSNGGTPSPIFSDGASLSLPIPASDSPTRFGEVRWSGVSLGSLVEDLSKGRIAGKDYCHLDPDLDIGALPRHEDWRPALGQAGGAQGHLANQGVGPGDLFLFFGWFKQVEKVAGSWRYVSGAPDLHRIFGWLQVGEVLTVRTNILKLRACRPWLETHPHAHDKPDFPQNTIYIATESLTLGTGRTNLPGGGVVKGANEHLVLTEPGQNNRSQWRLPSWFWPQGEKPILSHHGNETRWRRNQTGTTVRSAPIGQEFVFDISKRPPANRWLRTLLEATV